MMTKKASVIMLPTDKSNLATIKETNKLVITDNNHHFARGDKSEYYLTPQHLYFTTDDEIKGKGYRLDLNRMSVGVIDDDNYYNNPANGNFKKIVATTNKELWYSKYAKGLCPKCKSKLEIRLPETLWCENEKCDYSAMNLVRGVSEELVQCIGKIPTDFIEAYVREQGRIKEVLLEYEEHRLGDEHDERFWWELKLRPNGTVIIHRAKEKKYSREQVTQIVAMALKQYYTPWALDFDDYKQLAEDWMKENSI